MKFKTEIIEIAKRIEDAGGRMFVVGGAVRDEIRSVPAKDQDFMICGIWEVAAKEIISGFGAISDADVISNAPVFIARIDGEDFEFAMARIEVDVAPGKAGFEFISTPDVTLFDDLVRRDFTIGAIAVDVLSGEVFDPFGGREDIEHCIIRAVRPETFVQSPERAFRAFSQAARFNFTIEIGTSRLISDMSEQFDDIPKEQIWRHVTKAFDASSIAPENFLIEMVMSGWDVFFPEIHFVEAIKALRGLKGSKFAPEDVLAACMVDMSFVQEIRFRERILIPKRIFKAAVEIKDNGAKLPKRFVEGRDIAHVVPPGEQMGFWVKWCFVGQINGIFASKEEAVAWVEKSVEEEG